MRGPAQQHSGLLPLSGCSSLWLLEACPQGRRLGRTASACHAAREPQALRHAASLCRGLHARCCTHLQITEYIEPYSQRAQRALDAKSQQGSAFLDTFFNTQYPQITQKL